MELVAYGLASGLLTLVGILLLGRSSIFDGAAEWAEAHFGTWVTIAAVSGGAAAALAGFVFEPPLMVLPIVVIFTLLGSISRRIRLRKRGRSNRDDLVDL